MKKIDYVLQHAPEVPLQKPLTYEQEKEIELMVELMRTIDCDVCPAKDDCNEDSNSVECEDCWIRWMSQFAETPDELDLQFMTRTLLDCEAITCDNCPVYATNEDCDCDNRECGEIILNWMECILYDAPDKSANALRIKIKPVAPKYMPEKISKGDWIDLRAHGNYFLRAGDQQFIMLGVSMELPEGYEAIVAPRSSTYKNFGVIQTNVPGIIDNSFKGDDEWGFSALAMRDTAIKDGDRICQFRIQKNQPPIEFEEVESLGNPSRGGWGSTGKR